MPESTQWETMKPLAQQAQPIWEALLARAAQSPVLHHDDTTMRILDLRRPGSATAAQMDPERRGTFTSNICGPRLLQGDHLAFGSPLGRCGFGGPSATACPFA